MMYDAEEFKVIVSAIDGRTGLLRHSGGTSGILANLDMSEWIAVSIPYITAAQPPVGVPLMMGWNNESGAKVFKLIPLDKTIMLYERPKQE